MKHGVTRGPDGTYGFYWLGNRLSLEDFNEQLRRTAEAIKGELEALAEGMNMGSNLDAARIAGAKLDVIKEVLELPLCRVCKKIVREKWI